MIHGPAGGGRGSRFNHTAENSMQLETGVISGMFHVVFWGHG